MISKKEYIEQQVEGAFEDKNYIVRVLYNYFEDEVRDMTDEQFKQHLVNLNWEVEWLRYLLMHQWNYKYYYLEDW